MCFLISLCFIVLTIVLAVLIVKPGLHGMKFKGRTKCTVASSQLGEDISCTCGRHCKSRFKCSTVHVNYLVDGRDFRNVRLYQNEMVFAEKPMCSIEVCGSSSFRNNRKIKQFLDAYGSVGSRYDCLYNTDEPGEVILSVQSDKLMVILMLAIPLTLSVIAIVISFIFCYIWRKNRDPDTGRNMSNNNYLLTSRAI